MSDFAYTTVPGKVAGLLAKLREVGVPSRASASWLKSIGFTSSNDPTLVPVLKQIGFVDASGIPGDVWNKYRGKDAKTVLGSAIVAGYKNLYSTYPDAHNRSNTDLEHFFRTHTSAGKQVIDKMVSTFKSLAQNADFGEAEVGIVDTRPDLSTRERAVAKIRRLERPGMAININVQLTLPETADEDAYEKFFAAMKKHLFPEE